MTKVSFSHNTYVRLLKTSSELAKQYRIDCGLDKPEVKEEEVTVEQEILQVKELEKVEEKPTEFTKEKLQEKLTNAGIKFSNLAKEETLLKKALDNNLI